MFYSKGLKWCVLVQNKPMQIFFDFDKHLGVAHPHILSVPPKSQNCHISLTTWDKNFK